MRVVCEASADFGVVAKVVASVPEVLDERKDVGPDEADPYVLALVLMTSGMAEAARLDHVRPPTEEEERAALATGVMPG